MTWERFEREFCNILGKQGWWALRIPKDETGAQPFDVIAVNEKTVKCYDCKVISGKTGRFPLSRVEDNQWLAFERFEARTKKHSCGLVIFWNQNIYLVAYRFLKGMIAREEKSIDLKIMKPYLTLAEIEQILGYKLE